MDSKELHSVEVECLKLKKAINGQWFVLILGANHKTVAATETYTRKRDAKRAAKMMAGEKIDPKIRG